MARGISIHIGLNQIDPTHYGTTGDLRGCENDARAMQSIAAMFGYESTMLLTKQATALNVLKELSRAAQRLAPGDTLLLTYAGHGSQVKDLDNEEIDALNGCSASKLGLTTPSFEYFGVCLLTFAPMPL